MCERESVCVCVRERERECVCVTAKAHYSSRKSCKYADHTHASYQCVTAASVQGSDTRR